VQLEAAANVVWVPWQTAAALILFAAMFALPCAVIFYLRRSALRNTGNVDPAPIWFGYARALGITAFATWIIWLGLVAALDPWRVLCNTLAIRDPILRSVVHNFLTVLPPSIALICCDLLSHAVITRVRGLDFTFRETLSDSICTRLMFSLPAALLFSSFGAYAHPAQQWGTLLGIGFVVAAVLVTFAITYIHFRGKKRFKFETHALSFGPLRDRAFAMAEKAGVKLNQVYVMPMARWRMANAYASDGNNLILTDWLLQHLSRREVDAIMAHEVAHMKRRHLAILGWLLVICWFAPAIYFAARKTVPDLVWLALWVIGSLHFFAWLSRIFMRRFEREADADAVAIGADAEAFISALFRLDRLNLTPHEWSRFQETFLTHPSTARRIAAISERAGISSEAVLQEFRAANETAERYGLPTAVQEAVRDNPPLFSSEFKRKRAGYYLWVMMLSVIGPAFGAAWFSLEPWAQDFRWPIYIAGIVASAIAVLLTMACSGRTALAALRPRLLHRWRMQGYDFPPQQTFYVGLSPHGSVRVYEDCHEWDLGFIVLAPSQLSYLGEQTRFSLRPEQIRSIRVGPGEPSWWKTRRVYVEWCDPAKQLSGTFNLSPLNARSLWHSAKQADGIADVLSRWLTRTRGGPPPLPASAALPSPDFGEVTSKPVAPPKKRDFLIICGAMTVFSAILANMTGLLKRSPSATVYVIVAVLLNVFFVYLPLWRHRPERDAHTAPRKSLTHTTAQTNEHSPA
jgi:Zn-dependent protease with chaperone function